MPTRTDRCRFRSPALRLAAVAAPRGRWRARRAGAGRRAFTDQQRQAIGEIVRDYLLKNPEVLQEVMAELEKRQAGDADASAQAAALEGQRASAPQLAAWRSSPATRRATSPWSSSSTTIAATANGRWPTSSTLMKTDPKLRVVLKDFPVLGPDSVEASRVALAVKNQLKGEKLFDYHVKLMETRGRVNGERALAVAKEMGLDMARLQKDMDSRRGPRGAAGECRPRRQARPDRHAGLHRRRRGHPGAVGLEPLKQAVASVRQCGKASC